jgi:crotonobetainyl-CoA:carnitine CoA-transferase CaiB-like acyl-CoA transferase
MAPFLGEHNAEILLELGYSEADAKRLATQKVVFETNLK